MMPVGWYSRGYHPHFNGGDIPQMVTFRLAESIPRSLSQQWEQELRRLTSAQSEVQRRRRIERHLDRSEGPTWLRNDNVARLVENALLHFDGQRYRLLEWVLMANHVHVLFVPQPPHDLSDILQSWKSYTATVANRLLRRTGPFWERDYFDRYVRNERHLTAAANYIAMNPVKAGLCATPALWEWSSARPR